MNTDYKYEQFNLKRKAIREKNERLIKEWHELPWYKFWKKIPFEEQRRIIISNWEELMPDYAFL